MNNVQEKLKILQNISGKTQSELAFDLGVTTLAYSNWCRGVSMPRSGAMKKIDALLHSYGIGAYKEVNSILENKKNIILDLSLNNKNMLKKILSRPDLIDELSLALTYNSNAIEGSTLTIEDTSRIIFNKETLRNKTLNEQLEAKNHDVAFRFMLEYVFHNKKINEAFANDLHSKLMAGIREDAGMYRTHPVRIVGSYVPTANYIKIPELMHKLFSQDHFKKNLEYVCKFHADFEKIHPYSDGNGRVGRLLLFAMLLEKNIAGAIIIKKKRPLYYKALQKAQLEGQYEILNEFIYDSIIGCYKIIKE